jgi:hypothetical protein
MGIVAGGHQEQCRGVVADAGHLDELRSESVHQPGDLGIQAIDLDAQRHRPAPEGCQRGLGRLAHGIGIGMHPERAHPLGEAPRGGVHEAFSQLIGAGVDQLADLVERSDPRSRSAPAGYQQATDGLDVSISALGRAEGPTGLGSPSSFDGIERIGLSRPGPLLAVGSIHLHHRHAGTSEMPGQPGAV